MQEVEPSQEMSSVQKTATKPRKPRKPAGGIDVAIHASMFDEKTAVEALSRLYRSRIAVQDMRIKAGARIYMDIAVREFGVVPFRVGKGMKTVKIVDENGKKVTAHQILDSYLGSYRRITELLAVEQPFDAEKGPAEFTGDGYIKNYIQYVEAHSFCQLLSAEQEQEQQIARIVAAHPMHPWLSKVLGIGALMEAFLISYFDIARAHHAGSFRARAGIDVDPVDGAGRNRSEGHRRTVVMETKKGPVERRILRFDPFIQEQVIGVLGRICLALQNADKSPYRLYLEQMKVRLANHAVIGAHNDRPKGKKPRRCLRINSMILETEAKERAEENENPFIADGTLAMELAEEEIGSYRLLDDDETVRPEWKEYVHYIGPGWRYRMAVRAMVSRFMEDFFIEWCRVTGRPPEASYAEGVLKRIHHGLEDSEKRAAS